MDSETVTVRVTDGYAVYFDGEQRGGTLTDVPTDLAYTWERHGWANVVAPQQRKAPVKKAATTRTRR
jgi:hypothetical protein